MDNDDSLYFDPDEFAQPGDSILSDGLKGAQAKNSTISEDFTTGLAANRARNIRSVFGRKLTLALQSDAGDHQSRVIAAAQRRVFMQNRQHRAMIEEQRQQQQRVKQKREQEIDSTATAENELKRQAQGSINDRASKRRTDGRSQTAYEQPKSNGSKMLRSSGTLPVTRKDERMMSSSVTAADQAASPTGDHEETFPGYGTVYKIECYDSDTQGSCHRSSYFLDPPIHISQQNTALAEGTRLVSHLNGVDSISDFEEFVLQNYNNWYFIEIRELACAHAAKIQSTLERSRWKKSTLLVSELLLSKVLSIATYTPSGVPATHEPQDSLRDRWITAENVFFYHHRDQLREIANDESEVAQQVRTLLQYIDGNYGSDFTDADALLKQGMIAPKHLWKLFPPNSIIIGRRFGRPIAAVLDDSFTMPSGGNTPFSCWMWAPSPSGFIRMRLRDQFISNLPSTPVQIQSLPVVPLKYTDPQLIDDLCARGCKYWEYQGACHVSYTGWNTTGDSYYPEARFITDYKMYRTMHPYTPESQHTKVSRGSVFDRRPEVLDRRHDDMIKSDRSLQMCFPCEVQGFYLTEKKWVSVFIDNITPPKWNKQAFDRLVLPAKKKKLVKALITVRTSQRGIKQGLGLAGKREDLISGKGNGLIMLLHGSPGTGKSLTAESVAEIAEMPLYRVTCGDIGTEASSVEKYLNTVFHLGKAWNCVLLLDEADVFLEERSMSDLERNSLVSVFLRSLEYYDGILILTSNRVGTFDEAFRSRIQVALHYETLTTTSRRKIWQNFFDMLEEDKENANFDELREHLGELAEHEMNGRQIRNTVTTARQLAIYEKETLSWEHLEEALNVSTEFSTYLKKVQGSSSEDWARDVKIR